MRIARYLLPALLLLPATAHAHIVAGDNGFLAGLEHPVLGFDHLLAMISVGVISAQLGGRAIWLVPATFVTVMAVGGVLGAYGVAVPLIESGIALSVLVLGIAVAADRRAHAWIAMLFVGFFAIFHGYAHGSEMPQLADPWLYGLGFVSGTAVIHLAGVLIGVLAGRKSAHAMLLRFVGAGVAGVGLDILLGTLG